MSDDFPHRPWWDILWCSWFHQDDWDVRWLQATGGWWGEAIRCRRCDPPWPD